MPDSERFFSIVRSVSLPCARNKGMRARLRGPRRATLLLRRCAPRRPCVLRRPIVLQHLRFPNRNLRRLQRQVCRETPLLRMVFRGADLPWRKRISLLPPHRSPAQSRRSLCWPPPALSRWNNGRRRGLRSRIAARSQLVLRSCGRMRGWAKTSAADRTRTADVSSSACLRSCGTRQERMCSGLSRCPGPSRWENPRCSGAG